MQRYYMCLRIQRTSKEFCVHSGAKLAKSIYIYYCIYLFGRNSTIFKKMPRHFMQYVRYSFKRYCIRSRIFFIGRKTLSKYCSIYDNMLLQSRFPCSQRNTPPFPRKCQFPGTYLFEYVKPRQVCVCTRTTYHSNPCVQESKNPR